MRITCQSSASRQSFPSVPHSITPPSEQKPTFQVFPNPNNGNFTVTYELPRDAMLRITDLTGRTVKTTQLFADTQRQEILASELRPCLEVGFDGENHQFFGETRRLFADHTLRYGQKKQRGIIKKMRFAAQSLTSKHGLNPGLYYLQVVSEQQVLLHSQRIVIY